MRTHRTLITCCLVDCQEIKLPGVGSSKAVAKTQPATTDTTTETGISDYKAFYTAIAKSPTLTTAWSKMLKAAGYYKGPITNKYTPKLQRALDAAEQDRLTIAAVRPLDRDAFIQEQISVGGVGGTGGGTRKETYLASPTQGAALINSIFRDLLGRKANQQEIDKYYSMLTKAQKESPTVTTYSGSGESTSAMQTGGLNEQQYLIDQISKTDEARANKVLGFYNTFMNALGSK